MEAKHKHTGELPNGTVFNFDGTAAGFVTSAMRAGLKVFRPHPAAVYLNTPAGDHDELIHVYWNDWRGKYCAGAVVSLEPLDVILGRRA